MRLSSRLLLVLMFTLGFISATFAQTVSVSVTPTTGSVGTNFNITVSGLTANTEYTLAFVHVGSNSTVFSTTRPSNASGQLAMTITSEASDVPGEYRVDVQSGTTVVGSATFTLEVGATQPNETPNASGVQLRVIPESASIGSTYDIIASGLQPEQTVTLAISVGGEEVYSRTTTADAGGTLSIEIFTQVGDTSGTYTATLRDSGNTVLATDTFVVDVPLSLTASLNITSTPAEIGTKHTISVTGVKRFANLSVSITESATGNEVFFTRLRASVDGVATVDFISDSGIAAGAYKVIVREGDAEIAMGDLTVSDAGGSLTVTADTPNIIVKPTIAAAGTLRIVTASGLFAGEAITLEVTHSGQVVFSATKNADVNGNVALSVTGLEDAGDYQVRLKRATTVVAQTSLTVETDVAIQPTPEATPTETVQQPNSAVQISITPPDGPIGTVYNIRVTGLNANETVTIAVVLNGRNVYASERTSDGSGVATLSINSEEGDTPGAYSITVSRGTTQLASADFQIGGTDTAQPQTTPAPTATAVITIDPETGGRGTNHTISVTNLTPGETVKVNVSFGNQSVYATDRVADASGVVTLTLATEATDPTGVYIVEVTRADTVIASGLLTLTEDTAQPQTTPETDNVSVSITPDTGAVGTSHAVNVTGLDANETVTLDVLYQGSVVYTTERVADRNGVVTMNLKTEASDPTGIYNVQIKRQGVLLAEGVLTVADGATVQPTPLTTDPTTITGGGSLLNVTDELTSSATEKTFTFTGNEGDLVLIRASSSDFDTYVILFDNTDTELAYNDDSPTSLDSLIGPLALPYDGEYSVIVSSYASISGSEDGSGVGAFDLTVTAAAVTGLQYGAGVTADFSATQDLSFYRFEAQVGDIITASATGANGLDTSIALIDPTGVQVAADDDSGSNLDPEITRFVVLSAGQYILSVNTFNVGEAGAATVIVDRQVARDLSGGTQQLRLNTKQTSDVVTLNTSAGQTVLLNLSLLNGDSTGATLNVYQDGVLLMSYVTTGIPTGTTVGFVAPADGLVTIMLESDGTAAAVVEVSAQ